MAIAPFPSDEHPCRLRDFPAALHVHGIIYLVAATARGLVQPPSRGASKQDVVKCVLIIDIFLSARQARLSRRLRAENVRCPSCKSLLAANLAALWPLGLEARSPPLAARGRSSYKVQLYCPLVG